jgi:hypothetical protein
MNLREEILKEHSRRQADKIIRWVGDDPQKFEELVKLFLKGEYRVTQRAGWPLSDIAIAYPHLIARHLKKLLLNLDKPNLHNAVLRNTLRLLQFVKIPRPLQGLAAETAFRLLNDKKQPVAIRVFAMSVIGNLCAGHPELKQELKLSIEEQIPYGSPGFKARARMVLKQVGNN